MYTTQAKVEAYLERELTDYEAENIDDVIQYISNFISTYCNRLWLPLAEEDEEDEAVAEARAFDGSGLKDLAVDDFSELEEIRLLDSQGNESLKFTQETDWILTPANNDIKSCITLRNYHFPTGTANVEITAVWGAGIVPPAVIVVATAIVGKFLVKSKTTGQFKSENIEGYSYTLIDTRETDAEINRLLSTLDMYKKRTL